MEAEVKSLSRKSPSAPTGRSMARWTRVILLLSCAAAAMSCSKPVDVPQPGPDSQIGGRAPDKTRIVLLHHSTGEAVWNGGLAAYFRDWNAAHGTHYEISELTYPNTLGGHENLRRVLPGRIFSKVIGDRYPWDNYPYDYWNLWVAHSGERHDRSELNLDDLVRSYDVIVFKHCYPVSGIEADDGAPSVGSPKKTLANYQLQYLALKQRMRQFPRTRFILWTPTALTQGMTNPADAARAQQFSAWIKGTWDDKGDNIFLWDFRDLQTDGGKYVKPGNARPDDESHPSKSFASKVAPMLGRRIVDVVEGNGDIANIGGM
jgi:hypothetical protein